MKLEKTASNASSLNFARCWLKAEGGILAQTEEIEKFDRGRGRAAGQESQKLIRSKLSGAAQIMSRMDKPSQK